MYKYSLLAKIFSAIAGVAVIFFSYGLAMLIIGNFFLPWHTIVGGIVTTGASIATLVFQNKAQQLEKQQKNEEQIIVIRENSNSVPQGNNTVTATVVNKNVEENKPAENANTTNVVVENAVVENANTIPQENVDVQAQTTSPAQVTNTDSNNQN